ncbi:hypothetical protein J6590_004746 [Homalodisca vitripennis]|nr:hypothetical protein J6590_004746 [Homalodisca vitripennis]
MGNGFPVSVSSGSDPSATVMLADRQKIENWSVSEERPCPSVVGNTGGVRDRSVIGCGHGTGLHVRYRLFPVLSHFRALPNMKRTACQLLCLKLDSRNPEFLPHEGEDAYTLVCHNEEDRTRFKLCQPLITLE